MLETPFYNLECFSVAPNSSICCVGLFAGVSELISTCTMLPAVAHGCFGSLACQTIPVLAKTVKQVLGVHARSMAVDSRHRTDEEAHAYLDRRALPLDCIICKYLRNSACLLFFWIYTAAWQMLCCADIQCCRCTLLHAAAPCCWILKLHHLRCDLHSALH